MENTPEQTASPRYTRDEIFLTGREFEDLRLSRDTGIITQEQKQKTYLEIGERRYLKYLANVKTEELNKEKIIRWGKFNVGKLIIVKFRNQETVRKGIIEKVSRKQKRILFRLISGQRNYCYPDEIIEYNNLLTSEKPEKGRLFGKKVCVLTDITPEEQFKLIKDEKDVEKISKIKVGDSEYLKIETKDLTVDYSLLRIKVGEIIKQDTAKKVVLSTFKVGESEYIKEVNLGKYIIFFKIDGKTLSPEEVFLGRVEFKSRAESPGINPYVSDMNLREGFGIVSGHICYGDSGEYASNIARTGDKYQLYLMIIQTLKSLSNRGFINISEYIARWIHCFYRKE